MLKILWLSSASEAMALRRYTNLIIIIIFIIIIIIVFFCEHSVVISVSCIVFLSLWTDIGWL